MAVTSVRNSFDQFYGSTKGLDVIQIGGDLVHSTIQKVVLVASDIDLFQVSDFFQSSVHERNLHCLIFLYNIRKIRLGDLLEGRQVSHLCCLQKFLYLPEFRAEEIYPLKVLKYGLFLLLALGYQAIHFLK